MIDHMTFRVTDIDRTRRFYSAVLAPLGYRLAVDARHDDVQLLGFEKDGRVDTWFVDGQSPQGVSVTTGCHLAWQASSRAAVRAFHEAAIAAGGRDNGPPGLRPHYHAAYYGAFIIDQEGNNIEAVCHLSEPQG